MKEYRKAIKDYFTGIAIIKKLMGIDPVIWGVGLVFVVTSYYVGPLAGGILLGIGIWVLMFGMALAFIKKNDLALLIITGVMTLNYLVVIVLSAINGLLDTAAIFHMLGFAAVGYLCFNDSYFADRIKQAKQLKLEQKQQRERELLELERAKQVIREQQELERAKQAATEQQAEGAVECAGCGAMLANDSKFCPVCGLRVSVKKICPNCGQTVSPTAAFCDKCGTRLN